METVAEILSVIDAAEITIGYNLKHDPGRGPRPQQREDRSAFMNRQTTDCVTIDKPASKPIDQAATSTPRSFSRRAFLGLSATALASLALPSWSWAEETAAKNGAIVIVHTNDVHCAYAQAESSGSLTCFGYDGLAGYVAELRNTYTNVALVDAGDAVQGQAAGTLSSGTYLIDLMNACAYDVAIPGNHEFDFGMDQFTKLSNQLNAPYVSCNFNRQDTLVFNPYVVEEYKTGSTSTIRVAYVGVTTPSTLTASRPTSFKEGGNPNGETIYGFCEDTTGSALYKAIQNAVDKALSADGGNANYVVLLAHLGQTSIPERWRSDTVAKNTHGIDVIIDGHSHEAYVQVAQNSEGKDVIITQTGTQLVGIGRVILDPASGTVYAAASTYHKQAKTENCPQTDAMLVTIADDDITEKAETWAASDGAKTAADAVADVTAKVTAIAGKKVGYSNVKLWATEEDNYTWAVRTHETNCGDFVADAYWNVAYQAGAQNNGLKMIAMVNGGGVRGNLDVGDVTYGDLIAINPFNNQLCYATVTGQQILDALEMCLSASLATDTEGNVLDPMQLTSSGSFPHVSGLTCDVRIDIASTVTKDASGNFTGVTGERRVRNVKVAGEDIDPTAEYTLVSHTYWLVDNGSGLSMFKNLDVTYLGVDNQALIEYIDMLKDDTVSDYYANAAGTRRIVLKTSADEDSDSNTDTDSGSSSDADSDNGAQDDASSEGLGKKSATAQTGDATSAIGAAAMGLGAMAAAIAIASPEN